MQKKNKLTRIELSAMLVTALFLLGGARATAQQRTLADKVIRLHVLANSDSDEDQRVKLLVRDAVLEEARRWYDGESVEECRAALTKHLADLAAAGTAAARAAGCEETVCVRLEENAWFPTRVYEDMTFPAGRYTAVRVVIGAGEGHNWWCVVFPPLCLGCVSEEVAETAAMAGFSREEVSLLTGGEGEYVLRFRCMELWDRLRCFLEERGVIRG